MTPERELQPTSAAATTNTNTNTNTTPTPGFMRQSSHRTSAKVEVREACGSSRARGHGHPAWIVPGVQTEQVTAL
jgi:hypothetical protein